MAKKQRREKVTWQDALKAIQKKEEVAAIRQRHWTRLHATAVAELHSEGAIVFLGSEAVSLLHQTTPTAEAAAPPPTRFPLPAVLAAALAASAAGYAWSYTRVAAQLR